jgi:tRNA modification GTPase
VARALSLVPFADALNRPPVVRLVGPPNAGKSTLFNALLGTERALVSPTAGTTRDPVHATWSLRGVPVVLEDTAGGMPPSHVDVDLVVEVLEGAGEQVRCSGSLEVLGRADLQVVDHPLAVSGRTGQGLSLLRRRLAERLGLPEDPACDLLAPVDRGQRELLKGAYALDPIHQGSVR